MSNTVTVAAFLFGVFLQAYFLLRGKLILDTKNRELADTDWFTIIFLAIFCLSPLLFLDDSIDSRLMGVGLLFILFFPAFFHKKILSQN